MKRCKDCGAPAPFAGKFSIPKPYKIKRSDKEFPEHICESETSCKICIAYINSHSRWKGKK